VNDVGMVDGGDGPAQGAPADAGPISTLPEAVRQRVVTLTADALDALGADMVPAGLRPVLGFVRQRRARLAAAPIAAALLDSAFRERVATIVRPSHVEVIAALEQGEPVSVDPVEVAALTYLVRQRGWDKVLAESVERVEAERLDPREGDEVVLRVRHQLQESRAELDAVRARLKEQLADVKRDNAELRRKLATERSRTKQAVSDAELARAAQGRVEQEAQQSTGDARAEARRLRARVDELEEQLRGARSAERDGRTNESIRARLLLDTLLDAAQGLRRELALPPVGSTPAEAVAAGLDDGPAADVATRAREDSDPGWLEQLVCLPRAHLVVDGYNVTKNGWPSMPLEAQRARLMRELGPLAARSRAEVTVVFDGAELASRPAVVSPRGIRVLFSRPGVSADEVVRDLVRAEPTGRVVVVVSSDKQVRAWALDAEARSVPAQALLNLLARS